MSDCIFCKIAGGDIPSATLYEDDDFRVILDLGPATKGHALILPKHHYANLYEIPEEMAAKAMVLAKRMAAAMTEALGCDGFNIVQNNGEVAGQTVFHFHTRAPTPDCNNASVSDTGRSVPVPLLHGQFYNPPAPGRPPLPRKHR